MNRKLTRAQEEELRRKRVRRFAEFASWEAAQGADFHPRASAPPTNILRQLEAYGRSATRALESADMDLMKLHGGIGNQAVRSILEGEGAAREEEAKGQALMEAFLARDAAIDDAAEAAGAGVLPGPEAEAGTEAESAGTAGADAAGIEDGEAAGPEAPSETEVEEAAAAEEETLPDSVTVRDGEAGVDVTYDLKGGAPDVDLKQVQQALAGGKPLDPETKAYMEWRFGVDFSKVRLHTGPKADALSRALFAHAFALGSDVAFGGSNYRPGTKEGDRLLAHELTHVIQAGLAPTKTEDGEGKDESTAHGPLPRQVSTVTRFGEQLHKSDSVSEPTDSVEVEADFMADRVIEVGRSEFQKAQRDSLDEEEAPQPIVEDAVERRSPGQLVDDALRGAGQPLPKALRLRLEESLGAELSAVRIYEGSAAASAADAIRARAFTVGTDIVFGEGQYRPGTRAGDELIAHEVTHAVQHMEGRSAEASDLEGDVPVTTAGDSVEVEAEAAGKAFAEGKTEVLPRDGGARARETGAKDGSQDGPTHSGPTAPASSAAGPAIPRDSKGDKEKKPEDYSQAEIDAEINKAKTEGASKPPAEPVKEEGKEEVKEETKEAKEAEAPAKEDAAFDTAIEPVAKAAGKAPSKMSLAQLQGGSLSEWNSELAWNKFFNTPGMKLEDGLEVDKWGAMGDALYDGFTEGIVDGAKAVVIGQAMQLAATKIPYVAGFVEMAKIAYDPAAWVEGVSQGTYGKVQQAMKLFEGDSVDILEGVVALLEAVNNTIGTISNILWIVAAAGFIASFFFPFLIPFVAWCASAAKSLTVITACFGVILTLAKLLVMLLRAAKVALGPSDPAEVLHQTSRLKENTKAFTADYAANAGDAFANKAKGNFKATGNILKGPKAPKPKATGGKTPSGGEGKIGKGWKILSAVTGEYGDNLDGGGVKEKWETYQKSDWKGTAKEEYDKAKADYEEYKKEKAQAEGEEAKKKSKAKGKEAEVIAESDKRRQRSDELLAAAKTDHKQKQAALTTAEADLKAANAKLRKLPPKPSKKSKNQAVSDIKTEQTALRETAGQSRKSAKSLRNQADADTSTAKALRATEDPGNLKAADNLDASAKEFRDRAQKYDDAAAAMDSRVKSLDGDIETIETDYESEKADRKAAKKKAKKEVEKAEAKAKKARDKEEDAEEDLEESQEKNEETHETADDYDAKAKSKRKKKDAEAEKKRKKKVSGAKKEARDPLREAGSYNHDKEGNRTGDAWGESGGGRTGDLVAFLDNLGLDKLNDVVLVALDEQTGEGNKGAKEVDEVYAKEGDKAPEKERAGGPLGLWEKTLDDKKMDWEGQLAGGSKDENQAKLDNLFKAIQSNLPAPPSKETIGLVDGSRDAFDELDKEERKIEFQQQEMIKMEKEGAEQMTALDVVNKLAEANRKAAAENEAQLDTKLENQDEFEGHSSKAKGEASKGKSESAKADSKGGGFASKLGELLGIVPSKVVGSTGGAKKGAKGIGSGGKKGTEGSEASHKEAEKGVAKAKEWKGATKGAKDETKQQDQALQGLQGTFDKDKLSAQSGVDFLKQTKDQATASLADIKKRKATTTKKYDDAVGQMVGWVTDHKAKREKGLEALGSQFTFVEDILAKNPELKDQE